MILAIKLIASLLAANSLYFFWKSLSSPMWVVSLIGEIPGDFNIRNVAARNHEKRWRVRKQYAYLIATMIGFGITTYWIANELLSFLPDNLGANNEDGEYVSVKEAISTSLAGMGGFFIPNFLYQNAKKNLKDSGSE
jgi:hypothetical protein